MYLPPIKAGSTSNIVSFKVYDSSSTTGAGLPSLVYNTAGLVAYYALNGSSSATAITLATATAGTYASGGFVVQDATNMTSVYQLGIPNAAVASAGRLVIELRGAANMVPVTLEVDVVTNLTSDVVTALPTNFSATKISTGGYVGVDLATINTPTTGALLPFGILDIGTMQAGSTSTTAVLRAAVSYVGDPSGSVILVTSGTGAGQGRYVTGWNNTSKTATVSPAWATTPDATSTYQWFVGAPNANPIAIQKNVALNAFPFYLVSSADHVSPATGLTVTAQRSLDGGTFALMSNTAVEVANGCYYINLAQADTNADTISYKFTATGADPRVIQFVTQAN